MGAHSDETIKLVDALVAVMDDARRSGMTTGDISIALLASQGVVYRVAGYDFCDAASEILELAKIYSRAATSNPRAWT